MLKRGLEFHFQYCVNQK